MGPTKSLTFSRVFPKGCHDYLLIGNSWNWGRYALRRTAVAKEGLVVGNPNVKHVIILVVAVSGRGSNHVVAGFCIYYGERTLIPV